MYEELLEKLLRVYEGTLNPALGVFEIPVSTYTDEARLDAERALLRTIPMPVAHVSQLQSIGSCLVHDALGVPIVITRNRESELRAMLNVCRHRGTRLLEDTGFCRARKGFHCRYHGWTYDLDGNLTQIPREELFPSLDKSALNLRLLPVTERFGFVWVVATPAADYDFGTFLDPLEPDLGPLNLDSHLELNYELIQDGVFKGEDLWVCEQIQQGLSSGANEFLTYGIEEAPIQWWHDELNRHIEELS